MSLAGCPYCPQGPLDGRRGGVSMIYQELNLAPHLTVEENICLGREPNRTGFLVRAEARRRIRETLEFLHHTEIGLDEPVRRLSVGARQIVEITRALLDKARILVMDEPTSSLTLEDTERLFGIIRKLKAEGVAVIYISHFLEEVQAVADVYTVLRDGRNAGSGVIASTPLEEIIRLMVGKPVDELFPRVAHQPGGPLLSVHGLKSARMTEPVSLELRRGEILGLAGLIGSGRTETLRTIFGLDRAETGEVRVAGRPAPAGPRWAHPAGDGPAVRGPSGRGPGPGPLPDRQHHPEPPAAVPAPWTPGRKAARGRRRGVDADADRQGRRPARSGSGVVRRQPAEGRPWPGCCTSRPRCSCSTSRRGASTC